MNLLDKIRLLIEDDVATTVVDVEQYQNKISVCDRRNKKKKKKKKSKLTGYKKLYESVIDININGIENFIKSLQNKNIDTIKKVLKTKNFLQEKDIIFLADKQFGISYADPIDPELGIIQASATPMEYTKTNYSIHIIIDQNRFFQVLFSKDEHDAKIALDTFISVLKHELVHAKQFERDKRSTGEIEKFIEKESLKRSKMSPEKEDKRYFSNPEEIMAYAMSVVSDLKSRGLNNKRILQLISTENKEKIFKMSPILMVYNTLFKKEDKTLKRLYKYIYLYLTKEDNKE